MHWSNFQKSLECVIAAVTYSCFNTSELYEIGGDTGMMKTMLVWDPITDSHLSVKCTGLSP
jgi:hypothetical protein